MLDLMRRQSYLIYPIFGGIIVIFAINFGPGSSGCAGPSGGRATWAARVDGEAIRQHDFAMLYGRQLAYMRKLAGGSGAEFDAAMAERISLRKQVMDQLVERKVLALTAQRLGLQVDDGELLRALREQFGVKDVTYDVYENWVNRTFEQSTSRFEDDVRADLAAQHLAQVVTANVTVSDAELQDAFLRERDRARLTFARFTPDVAAVPPADDAAVTEMLGREADAVRARYERDAARYTDPESKARKPLAAVEQEVARGLIAERVAAGLARDAATRLLTALRAGKAWAALTDDEDAAPSATKAKASPRPLRRDTGWVSRYQESVPRIGAAPELLRAAFTLTAQAPIAGEVFAVGEDFVVVGLAAREHPDLAVFATERTALREAAVEAKRSRVLRDWLAYLRNQAKVQMNPSIMAMGGP